MRRADSVLPASMKGADFSAERENRFKNIVAAQILAVTFTLPPYSP